MPTLCLVVYTSMTDFSLNCCCFVGDLIEGLKLNALDQNYSHLLTGYIGNPSFLQKVAEVVKYLKTINPSLIYGKST